MGPPSDPPVDVVALLVDERSHLLELLSSVRAHEWTLPTACPGWTVLDLAAHLLGDDLSVLSRHRDGYLGTMPPAGADDAAFVAWLDDLQEEWVRAARRVSPELMIQLLRWTGPRLARTFGGRDPRARTAEVSWAGPAPVPVWLDLLRDLSEYWIHRQQLRWALGLPSDVDADVLDAILDGFRWAYPFRLAQVAAAPGDTVTIDLTGLAARRWLLVASATGWDFADEPGKRHVGRLQATSDDAWRLLTNNLPPADQGRVLLEGDASVTRVLRSTRSIIGAPNS